MGAEILPHLSSWNCFACGRDHPSGLRLVFSAPERDRVRSEFVVSTEHVGLGTVVHGGIIATVLDEAMAWALYRWRYQPHVTAHMEQRFRSAIYADTPLVTEAWIDTDRGRRRAMRATISGADGATLAEASGVYLPAPTEALDMLTPEQRAELDDIFVQFREIDG